MNYADFLASKRRTAPESGVVIDADQLGDHLKPFQRQLVAWAVRRGRAALFAATGLGKTRMQLEWARQACRATNREALILAPLAVAEQTIREARDALGLHIRYVRDDDEVQTAFDDGLQIVITNYDRLHKLDPSRFSIVVLDESSILKAFSGATKKALVAGFRDTPWRLACTATPAPNDIEELCNHADFLSVMSPAEMRSTFFIADSRGEFMRYRLKGHARTAFYRWLASWAMALDKPSDLGCDDDGYDLPALHLHEQVVESDYVPEGELFAVALGGVTERAQVRKSTLEERVARTAALVAAEPDEQWLLWCGLNTESAALAKLLPEAVEVTGSDDPDVKAARLLDFAEGRTRVLITKASIAGWGLNLQRCARMAFVGIGDSYETYHQAIRRCWRFGQQREVHVHIVISDLERLIYQRVRQKEAQAKRWTAGLVREAVSYERAELLAGTSAADDFEPRSPITLPDWMVSA